MIDPKELRIGNLITQGGGHILEVTSILTHGVQCFNKTYGFKTSRFLWDELIPIPITPEWLVRFGFKGQKGLFETYYELADFEYHSGDKKFGISYGEDNLYCIYDIQYIHQLQNIYFALTGQELTVKETV
jgi:hypothetical protein